MNQEVTLHVTTGRLKGKQFAFGRHTKCLIGRSRDCEIQVPDEWEFRDVSRHHCELEIDPPVVRVRDLGSLNGTYVNGEKIGQRELTHQAADATIRMSHDLRAGDEIKVGHVVLRVGGPAALPQA